MERTTRKIEILIFLVLFSLPTLAFQKFTTTQMRENSIRINALEINDLELTVPEMTIVLDERALNFDFDKAVVKEKYYPILENLKEFMVLKNYEVVITGHTDSIGKDEYNLDLSRRRAEAVKEKLIQFGMKEDRIKGIVAKGESEPIASNINKEERFKNRRVEFHLTQRVVGKE